MNRLSTAFVVLAFAVGVVGSGCGGDDQSDDSVATPVGDTVLATTSTIETASTVVVLEPTTTTLAPTPVFDFPTPDDVNEWFVVNDTVMGGVSTGRLAWDDDALVFTGDLSLDNNGGFASVRSPLLDPTAVAPWTGQDGMRIEVGGDGREWTVEVRMDGDDGGGWISEMSTLADGITTVDVPWASFEPVTRFLDPREATEPLDPARIVSVAFYLVDGIEAPFRFELRSVS